jgi:hypothetical protein
MRTHFETDGVGPSRMKSWCQPGGQTNALGGAVIVHVWPEQEKAGKMVLPPIVLPCVLDVAVLTLSIYKCHDNNSHTRYERHPHFCGRPLE